MNYGKLNREQLKDAVAKESNVNIFAVIYAKYDTSLLEKYLGMFGVKLTSVKNETDLEDLLSQNKYDIIITDIPDDTKKITAFIRKIYAFAYPAFIIVVTKNYDSKNAVISMEAGAICCMMFPLSYDVLLAQIQILLRTKNNLSRTSALSARKPNIDFGDFSIDTTVGRLYYKGRQIPLTPDALAILSIMAENLESIVSLDLMCMKVYGTVGTKAVARLRMQIKGIREALGMDSSIEILNMFGKGYGLSVVKRY